MILIAENGTATETETENATGTATAIALENLIRAAGRSTTVARREVARPVRITQAFGKVCQLLLLLLRVLVLQVLQPRRLEVQTMTRTVTTRIVSTAEDAIITPATKKALISSLAAWSVI